MIEKLEGFGIFENINGELCQTGYSKTAKIEKIQDKINEIIDYINKIEQERN